MDAYACEGSTEAARTVTLLAVEALEMSRRKAGRSGRGVRPEESATSSTVGRSETSEAAEALVLEAGEGFDEAGAEWGIGDE